MLALRRRLAVQEGQLGQSEEQVRIALRSDHGPMQVSEGDLGALPEGVEEPSFEEHVARRPAGLACGDGAPREIPVGDRAIDTDGSHGRDAGAQGQAEGCEKDDPPLMNPSGSRTHAPGLSDIRGSPARMRTEKRGSRSAA